MRLRLAGLFHSRILLTLVLAFLIVSQGGAAHEIKGGHDAVALSVAYPHREPTRVYSAQPPFGKACLNCHTPVSCLATNLCPDCHQEVELECAEPVGQNDKPPDTDTVRVSDIEQQRREDAACDQPLGAINHVHLSGFSLNRHRAGFDGTPIACEDCHPDGRYDAASVACTGCHAQEAPVYMADHTGEYEGDCLDCHDGWGRMTGLEEGEVHVLDGAHKDAGCRDCHTGSTFAEEVRGCSDCHEGPQVHAGEAGQRCEWCHTVVAWLPAQLTEHSFRLEHGGLDEASCEACHTETYEIYTCYGCHDHQSAEIQERHGQEGIEQLEPCGRCHPSGVHGEAARLGYGLGAQVGTIEAPVLNPGGQLPAGGGEVASPGGAETAPPGQEGGEQTGPVESLTGSTGGLTEPTPSMPGEQDPAPVKPDDPGDALSPALSRGG